MTTSELTAVRSVESGDATGLADQVHAPLQVQAPVQQFRWQSRFGTMLIEVRVDALYVNGQRVEQAPPNP